MDVKGKWLLPTSPQKTWEALNNPEVLKTCIPGCESITDTGTGH
ncbi:MAG: carbon monoxide dehydrogenase, partial [Thiomonas sp. 20-64-9]